MIVESISLKNFRSYQDVNFSPICGTNLIVGRNAQGKTNLIEPIYIISALKSFRSSKVSDCIKEGSERSIIEIKLKTQNFGTKSIKYVINNGSENEYYVNGNKVTKKRDQFSHSYAVVFSPDELKIVKGAPEVRRDFLDTDICQVSSLYCDLIERYDKVLQNRNRLLKFGKGEKAEIQLDVYDIQLSTLGGQITTTRENFISKMSQNAELIMAKLSENSEKLTIQYVGIEGSNREEKSNNLLSELQRTRGKDKEVGYTSVGPHRDDLKFFINGKEVKPFASQGQQRSVVLALKLAEMETIKNEKEEPILILDDVFSELDNTRKKNLVEYLSGKQVFISTTNSRGFGQIVDSVVRIKNSKIYPQKVK